MNPQFLTIPKISRWKSMFAALALLFLSCGQVSASTVALFPLLDLTLDANGVNFLLTENVRQKLVEDGFEVIPENEVMDFMVRYRIRSLGTLSSYEIAQLRKELRADFALLGTVCQLENMPTAKISLSMQLVRTSDEEIVWSTIHDLHKDDMISLLKLNDPETLNDLYQEYFGSILESIPATSESKEAEKPFINLMYVDFRPLNVKPGEKIDLTARFYSNVARDTMPTFHLEIDGETLEVEVDEDSHFLNTSFLARELTGSYRVNLIAQFPGGEREVMHIGEYTVDATPPELIVNFIGREIDGEVYFSRDLIIMSKLAIPEQLSMWDIVVYDEEGDPLVTQTGEGQIPQKIYWNGYDDNAELTPDGKYRLVVTVWDRARNKDQVEKFAYHRHDRPEIRFFVTRNEENIKVELENQVDYPLSDWFVKIYKKNGMLVLSEVGEALPPSLEFKVEGMADIDTLEMIFAARDIFGNTSYTSMPDLLNLAKKEVKTEVVPESQWLENF